MTPIPGFRLAVRDLSPAGLQQFLSDRWTITPATTLPGFPISKLQTDLLSDYWCAYNHRSSNCYMEAVSDDKPGSTTTHNIGVIGLLELNRRSPTAPIPLAGVVLADGSTVTAGTLYTANTVRFRVDSYPLASRTRPACTLSSKVNLTGADANFTRHPIDPPDDPAPAGYLETKLSPTSSLSATSLVATFTANYATERALAGTHTLRVHVHDVNNPLQIPLLTTVLYQLGSPVATLTVSAIEHVVVTNSSGGFILTYTFATSSLASTTAAIAMHIAASTACDFIGIELVLNLTGHLYDSGVETYIDTDVYAFAERLDLSLTGGVTYLHAELSDFCSYVTATYTKVGGGTASANIYTSITAPGDSDGRLHCGRFLAADAVIFPINGAAGFNSQAMTNETSSSGQLRTRSGASKSTRSLVTWTEMDLQIIKVSRALKQKIMRQKLALGLLRTPTLLVPDTLLTEGYMDEETRPRWVMIGSMTETHVGRLAGIDDDALADGLNHVHDHWDINIHLLEHSGVRF